MNLIDKNQMLPAGLVDDSIEFYLFNNEACCLFNGKSYRFENFPTKVIEHVKSDMDQNPKAVLEITKMGIVDHEDQMRQYIACRFGGFDNRPDFDVKGNAHHVEYVNCGRRGQCKHEGKLCASIELPNGMLTKREIEVVIEIADGLLDKEICEKLFISQDTLRSHKDNISQKGGITRKSQITALAFKYGLL